MDQYKIYYNTMPIDDDGLGFVVGLITELPPSRLHVKGRSRNLLAYMPVLRMGQPAYPVLNEKLHVITRKAWEAAPDDAAFLVTDWFLRYPMIDSLTYFDTYDPFHNLTPHILPGDRWRRPIQLAKQQLHDDLERFTKGQPTKLMQLPVKLEDLGYF
ncbi:hypothetical protein ACFQ5J_12385 [Lacticaseibacillus baoqingensis]|uniref:Uncharacterized protein n=1 Tax=Lacticaseibacillus baoqingensis TaxID=2486013 RepID=A0ABW4EC92_9LACO|nr:hypothetical protein [Lacticaseibacillus baoqingensis]